METEVITTTQMYWITRLSPLGDCLDFIICLLFILAAVFLVAGGIMQDSCFNEDSNKRGIRLIKTSPLWAVAATVLMIANCLLPTTKEMAAILIVPRIVNNEKVQTVGNHLYDLAVEWMDELRPAKGDAEQEARK